MIIELTGLTKSFGPHRVLDGITRRLEFTHTLALIGPSGGGKSTLLRILAGLLAPDGGTVRINGEPLPADVDARRRYRTGIGIVFQAYNLFPHLTARENILLPLVEVHGLPRDEARARAEDVLARFQLTAHAGKHPAALSGGQRQRIAIARAIATQPRFLLFDEPTSALDPEMTAEVLDLLAELRAEGRTLILVTHEMGFARHTADLAAFVAQGTLLEVAEPAQLFAGAEHPDVRRFLGRILRH